MSDPTYKIKGLVWHNRKAETVGGYLLIEHESGGAMWDVYFANSGQMGAGVIISKPTQHAAKLAAEQWHRDRLLPALEGVRP